MIFTVALAPAVPVDVILTVPPVVPLSYVVVFAVALDALLNCAYTFNVY